MKKTDNPRLTVIGVRVTQEEAASYATAARYRRLTLSEFARRAFSEYAKPAKPLKERHAHEG